MFHHARDNRINRKKLGGESKGTEVLFGQDKLDYKQSSNNQKIARPQSAKLAWPKVDTKELIKKELYGETGQKFGLNDNKHDGALMAQCVDWKNPHTRAIECSSPLKSAELDCTERKHQNLQSSVFGGGYIDQEPITVDKSQQKIAFASNSDWKTRAGQAHPDNATGQINAYNRRQHELASGELPLDLNRYEDHLPQNKTEPKPKEQIEITDQPRAKGRKADSVLYEGQQKDGPASNTYDAKQRALAVLQGNYQKVYTPVLKQSSATKRAPVKATIDGRKTKGIKQAMLASNDFNTGNSTFDYVA